MPFILFNKPYNVQCQFSGPSPNLSDHIHTKDVYAAGRLDKRSEGLLILTDDGRLQSRITEPKMKLEKYNLKSGDNVLEVDGQKVLHINDVNKELLLRDAKVLKVADLVNDEQRERDKIEVYLNNINSSEDIDIIIALGKAKEGFDWPFCEHALTVGYRGSLTEIIQVIGRATRDSNNKTHAQFTNLIAQPDAADDEVKLSVNNMLKAITASLLMEQVLAPNWKFKPKKSDDDKSGDGEIKIRGFKIKLKDNNEHQR